MVATKMTFTVGEVYPLRYGFGFGVLSARILRILAGADGPEIEFRLTESGYRSRVSGPCFKLLYLDAISPVESTQIASVDL